MLAVAAVFAVGAIGPFGSTAWAQEPVDLEAGAIRQLRKATVYRANGLHHSLLLALRDLRDPTMKPLFQSLVQADHWSIQLDAILGLAELSDEGRVDPWLLAKLRSDRDRADGVRVALELGLLQRPEIEKILAWDDLASVARVVLLAEYRRLGGTPDHAMLTRLATNPDPPVAGLAACLLAEGPPPPSSGGAAGSDTAPAAAPAPTSAPADPAALAAFAKTLDALSAEDRDAAIEEVANAARRYQLTSAIDLLAPRVDGSNDSPGPQESVVGLALALDAKRGLTLWKTGLGKEPSQSKRVRYGLILLLNATRVPADSFDSLLPPKGKAASASASSDPLLAAMVAAGKAMASGREPAKALTALYDMGHRRCCRWVLTAADELDTAGARSVYLHVIDRLDVPKERTADALVDAIEASARLIERDPEALRERLLGAADDGPKQEAMLLGLANSRSPAAATAAESATRLGAGRADTLALVVLARHRDSLSPDELRQLGLVAGGGGQIDESLRAQAAWLYLRHLGKLEQSLPKIVGGT